MKKIIKNPKKGAAIELALVTMVVVFSLTSLLLGITLISKTTATNTLNEFEEKTKLAQDAKNDIKNNKDTYEQGEYFGNKYKLTVKIDGGKIVEWTYTLK